MERGEEIRIGEKKKKETGRKEKRKGRRKEKKMRKKEKEERERKEEKEGVLRSEETWTVKNPKLCYKR